MEVKQDIRQALLRLKADSDYETVIEWLEMERAIQAGRLVTLAISGSKSAAGVAGQVQMLDELIQVFRTP
jgi:hypothetical protein